jgi:4-hydroxy-2-oxoheptanedioate aldolase
VLRQNTLKPRLLAGEQVLGPWVTLDNAATSEIFGLSGFDFVIIDQEHGRGTPETLIGHLQALSNSTTTCLVRVPSHDPVYFKRVLDVGVEGVVIPNVQSAEEAKALVSACRYPPRGMRGSAIGQIRASNYGLDGPAYRKAADDTLLIICQIETATAVDAIAEIAAVDGVDALFVGPFDLSGSIGHLGEFDHPDVIALLAKAEAALKKTGKPFGTVPRIGMTWADMFALGYTMVTADNDVVRLRDTALADIARFRARSR